MLFYIGMRRLFSNFAEELFFIQKLIIMKKIFFAIFMLMPLMAMAQSNWEVPGAQKAASDNTNAVKVKKAKKVKEDDSHYLKGTVPEIDGKVVYTLDIDLPGKTADEVYAIVYSQLEKLTKDEHQNGVSQIALVDKDAHSIVATYQEWIVFKETFLELDRTLMDYAIKADCKFGKCHMEIMRINYKYEIKRRPQYYAAEEIITDSKILSKDGKKLNNVYFKKFRKKTVDRMNEIQETLRQGIQNSL